MPKQYQILKEHLGLQAGDTVYESVQGVAEQDTKDTGEPHIFITYKADGSGPAASIPVSKLKEQQTRQAAASSAFAAEYGRSNVIADTKSPNVGNTHIRTHKP